MGEKQTIDTDEIIMILDKKVADLADNKEFMAECHRFVNRCIDHYGVQTNVEFPAIPVIVTAMLEYFVKDQMSEKDAQFFRKLVVAGIEVLVDKFNFELLMMRAH